MSITDIPLTTSSVPTPPSQSIESLVQTAKGDLSTDTQSGSILKVLMENGFQAKMQEGYAKGHRYTILHSAPSPDFTLIDSWTEPVIDESGVSTTAPRKAYQFFKIKDAGPAETVVARPEEVTAPQPSVPLSPNNDPAPAISEPISDVILPKEEPAAPSPEPAGKNWLEQRLGMKQAVAPEPIKTSPVPSSAPIAVKNEPGPVASRPVAASPTQSSSYELLRKRFAQAGGSPAPSKPASLATFSVQETAPSKEPGQMAVPQAPGAKDKFMEIAFGSPVQGTVLDTWNKMKKIPARPFAYPAQYAWGTGPDGKPIERTTDNYPPLAEKFRGFMAPIVDQLKKKDVDVDTVTLEDALAKAESFGLL